VDIAKFMLSLQGLMSQLHVLDVDGNPTSRQLSAFAQAPFSLTETDLPTWIFVPRAATYPNPPDQTEDRLAKETRDFELRLYVTISQTGIDGEAQRQVEPYIDPARDHIQKHVRLWDGVPDHEVPGLMRAYLLNDTGVAKMIFGSADKPIYAGISYTVRVECLNLVEYANQ
jgi:hypothetical protein